MTIAAKISSTELTAQVTDRFADTFFEARLINVPGTIYDPGITNDAAFLSNEVTIGTGGYKRALINWTAADVSVYSDDGVALNQKAATYAQDGSATTIDFSHVALVWSTGNPTALGTATAKPTTAVNGTYTAIPVDSTSGSGVGLTVDITVANSGAALGDFALSVNSAGYGYAQSDTVTISNSTLQSSGITVEVSGDLTFPVSTVYTASNAGDILSVAQTANSVVVSGGNEVAFYFNLKQFGFSAS